MELLALALFTIVLLFILILKFKVNPFLGLLFACIFLGLTSGLAPAKVASSITSGIGSTLGTITAVLALGTMIGKLMAESGAADVIARRMIDVFGESNVHWAIAAIAYIIGISVFFQVGVVLLIPLLFTVALRTGTSLVTLFVPLVATLSTIHHFVPPHPAVMALVGSLKADLAKTLGIGLLVSVPCAALGGAIYGKWIGSRILKQPPPDMVAKFCGGTVVNGVCQLKEHKNPPGFGISVFTLLFPVMLMLLSKVAELMLSKGSGLYDAFKFLGDGNIALFVSLALAMWTFGFSRGLSKEEILKFTSDCLGPVTMILLVIGSGGAFGKILVETGVAAQVAALAMKWSIHPLILGWLLAAIIRASVGSATVAMITAAGLVAPMVGPGSASPELMIMAIGSGSCAFSHVNDTGFWMIKEFFGLTVQETFKTWSVAITLVSIVGMPVIYALHLIGL